MALDLSGGGPLWASRSPGAPAGGWTDSGEWVMEYTGWRDARLLVIDSAAAGVRRKRKFAFRGPGVRVGAGRLGVFGPLCGPADLAPIEGE